MEVRSAMGIGEPGEGDSRIVRARGRGRKGRERRKVSKKADNCGLMSNFLVYGCLLDVQNTSDNWRAGQ